MTLTVLVLCTHNTCRSIMAEGILNHYGKDKILAFSAGSFPEEKVNPMSLATLKRHGMSDQGYRSKSWDEFVSNNHFPQSIDILITVCDNAAGEVCPIFPGKPLKTHWGVPDPSRFQGLAPDVEAEFDRVFCILERRFKALLDLPLEDLDRDDLQRKLNEIGAL
jgi:arsenate reductase